MSDAIVATVGELFWSGFIGCTVCGAGKLHNEPGEFTEERENALHTENGFYRIDSFLSPMYGEQHVFVCGDECEFRYNTEVGPRRLRLMREGRARQGLEVK